MCCRRGIEVSLQSDSIFQSNRSTCFFHRQTFSSNTHSQGIRPVDHLWKGGNAHQLRWVMVFTFTVAIRLTQRTRSLAMINPTRLNFACQNRRAFYVIVFFLKSWLQGCPFSLIKGQMRFTLTITIKAIFVRHTKQSTDMVQQMKFSATQRQETQSKDYSQSPWIFLIRNDKNSTTVPCCIDWNIYTARWKMNDWCVTLLTLKNGPSIEEDTVRPLSSAPRSSTMCSQAARLLSKLKRSAINFQSAVVLLGNVCVSIRFLH